MPFVHPASCCCDSCCRVQLVLGITCCQECGWHEGDERYWCVADDTCSYDPGQPERPGCCGTVTIADDGEQCAPVITTWENCPTPTGTLCYPFSTTLHVITVVLTFPNALECGGGPGGSTATYAFGWIDVSFCSSCAIDPCPLYQVFTNPLTVQIPYEDDCDQYGGFPRINAHAYYCGPRCYIQDIGCTPLIHC